MLKLKDVAFNTPKNSFGSTPIESVEDLKLRLVSYVDSRTAHFMLPIPLRQLAGMYGKLAKRFSVTFQGLMEDLHESERIVLWTPPKGGRAVFSLHLAQAVLDDVNEEALHAAGGDEHRAMFEAESLFRERMDMLSQKVSGAKRKSVELLHTD